MGYTTDFTGAISISPPLSVREHKFLTKFASTRRMNRRNGPYFVNGSGSMGQGQDSDIIDYNEPSKGQPSLWCQWVPDEDGENIVWDGNEKFYESDKWMKYLIEHFIGSTPRAADVDDEYSFFKGHICNGEIEAQGEDPDDRWKLIVKNNVVTVKKAKVVWD
jgi:hypothetical protein